MTPLPIWHLTAKKLTSLFQYGDAPLHTAARYGHVGVTRILVSARCRVSGHNKNGDTALHIAAAMGKRKLVRVLAEAGVNTEARNNQGDTARDIAIRKPKQQCLSIGFYQAINDRFTFGFLNSTGNDFVDNGCI